MRSSLLLGMAVLFPAAVQAAPIGFDEAVARALASAPALEARALDIDSRASAAIAAGRLPDPQIGIGVDSYPVSGSPAFDYNAESMTYARLAVSQQLPNLAKRHAQRQRAVAETGEAEAAQHAEWRQVRLAAALAWLDLHYAGMRQAATTAAIARLAPLGPASTAGVASGAVRPGMVAGLRGAVAALEDRGSEARAAQARAQAELARWTGQASPEATGDVPVLALDPERLREAVDHHPGLAMASAAEKSAAADLALAHAELRPDWGVDLAYQRRAQRYGDMVSAMVSMSVPLFAGKRQNPMIASRVAAAGASAARREDMRRQLAVELETALAIHQMRQEQFERFRDVSVVAAREKAALETAGYAAGRATLAEVLEAQIALADAEIELIERESAERSEAARILMTFGDDNQ